VVGGTDASGGVGVELMPPPLLPHAPRNNPQLNAADRRRPAFVPRMTSALFITCSLLECKGLLDG
jgi:hypothetical protein